MSEDIKVTDGTVLESLNGKVDLDGGNYIGSGLDKIIHEHCGGTGLQMFDTILKDHILTYEESQGLALQGTYVYKEALAGSRYGYPDFYNKVIEEYNQATGTETINDVAVKVHSNGHKFYNIADKTGIDEFFNSIGSAWFYGVDTANERIFLPRDKYFAIEGIAPTVGTGRALGVTNDGSTVFPLKAVQTTSGSWDTMPNLNVATTDGVPASSTLSALNGRSGVQDVGGSWDNSPSGYYGVSTDPQSSGLETHLQPKEDKYLYICVGNTTNYEGISEVVNQGMEILDQINAGFVPKDSMEEIHCIVATCTIYISVNNTMDFFHRVFRYKTSVDLV